jgi:hypothetical protein
MSIATFESPQVATQQFFPWVFEDQANYEYSVSEPTVIESAEEFGNGSEVACEAMVQNVFAPSFANEQRIGKTVRLGAVMIKLLKSYGITDDEIAAGMAAYAANAGLAQAG